ncbi:MAG TPA: amidohydrolase family protein, partial [Vicinamibacterales bacterium]|nr:amidohydrolase family protein [Vicinamibacterales bacterium]
MLNGRVWTGLAGRSEAGAVAVAGDRIAAVGPTSALAGWRGRATTVIDARGARIVPGFNDSHVHLMAGGRQLDSVDLREAASPAELARLVGERAAVTPAGSWVLGGGWDEQRWDRAL